MPKQIFFVIGILLVLVGFNPCETIAQDGSEPIYKGSISNFKWADDSQSFVFQGDWGRGVITERDSWYQYFIETTEMQQSNYWPLQPILTEKQKEKFELGTWPNQITFVFPSPDERYIVYAAQVPPEPSGWQRYRIGFADLQTEQHIVFQEMIVDSLEWFGEYDVLWSADSTAFVAMVGDYGMYRPFYVTNFKNTFEDMTVKCLLYNEASVIAGTYWTDYYMAHDISADGTKLLLEGPGQSLNRNNRLVLWDARDSENPQTIVETDYISDADFVPGNEQFIVYTAPEMGVYLYDSQIQATERLMTDAKIDWSGFFSHISPDARKIAVSGPTNDSGGRLYDVINISLPLDLISSQE